MPAAGDMRCQDCDLISPLCREVKADRRLGYIASGFFERVRSMSSSSSGDGGGGGGGGGGDDASHSASGTRPGHRTATLALRADRVTASAMAGRGANSGGSWHQDEQGLKDRARPPVTPRRGSNPGLCALLHRSRRCTNLLACPCPPCLSIRLLWSCLAPHAAE